MRIQSDVVEKPLLKTAPEILAPVGDFEMFEAAIHNGANAIYVGAPDFNARGRSKNFTLPELKEIIEKSHEYEVRVYVAFNIVIFQEELQKALELYCQIRSLGPDAFILQDAGLAKLIRTLDSNATLHASTQMTITSGFDTDFYQDLKFARFTLSRELTLNDIRKIRKKTVQALEAFIHGSLCIAFSGQCFTSAGFGGRSANRGECAQSCRHEYTLVVDGKHQKTKGPYLVSPHDLSAFPTLQSLNSIGVDAYKIEGRLKGPQYVAAALRLYREESKYDAHESELTYSRGFSTGWLEGVNSKLLVDPSCNSHRGIYFGVVEKITERSIFIKSTNGLSIDVAKGDGLFFPAANTGGFIFHIEKKSNRYVVDLSRDFPLTKIARGDTVYLTSSVPVQKRLSKTYKDKENRKRIPIRLDIKGKDGEPLELRCMDKHGNEITVYSARNLEKAQKNSLEKNYLTELFTALGGSVYKASGLRIDISPGLFLPQGVLKDLKKTAIVNLNEKRREMFHRFKQESLSTKKISSLLSIKAPESTIHEPKLNVLIRDPSQVESFRNISSGNIGIVYLDYSYGRDTEKSFELLHNLGFKIGLVTERIMKPGEERRVYSLFSKKPDEILVRNSGALQYLKESLKENPDKKILLSGDFSLNITNSFSAGYFLNKGLSRITASYDLVTEGQSGKNISNLVDLLNSMNPNQTEVVIHYYLPSFYMEYCLYADHLGQGGNFNTCGRPCEKAQIGLLDRVGEFHPVFPDKGCRNIMYNGQEKKLDKYIVQLKKLGVNRFRMEALNETPEELSKKMLQYLKLLE